MSEATECVSDHGKATCKDIHGECITHSDGYYLVSGVCMSLGLLILVIFIIPKARKLQGRCIDFSICSITKKKFFAALPTSVWRIKL